MSNHKFSKREIEKYNWVIQYVRKEVLTGRDLWASLESAGLSFLDEIKRFAHYASQEGAFDISEPILKEHPEFI